ncbi:MAG: hypothetical protein ABJZ55_12850 [Fuerstiella sp.]
MSRMIAAFEALPHSARPFSTSQLPTANSLLAEIDRRHPERPERLDSWSSGESPEKPTEFDGIQNENFQPNSPRIELVHSCEEISQQLLQIRNGLQAEHSNDSTVQLRIFA